MSHRDELLELLKTKSLQKGDFTLVSGQKSTYYINGKLSTLDARGAYLTARIFLAMLADDVPDAVGGLTLGADPIVGAILSMAGMEDLALKGFIVRKAAKGHGTQPLIEGPLAEGDRAVIIEDVVTTGGNFVQARWYDTTNGGARILVTETGANSGDIDFAAVDTAGNFYHPFFIQSII